MIALFLGKFQPPHIGHLVTIGKLCERYDKVIVGITQSSPNIISQNKVIEIFKLITNYDKEKLEFKLISGEFTKGESKLDFEFDIICSGNKEVLKVAEEKNIKNVFIERYNDSLFSGTNERKVILNNLKKPERPIKEIVEIKVQDLRPIEKINRKHFESLEKQILIDRMIIEPIIVDMESKAVLDGSHRYAFCIKYQIPSIKVLLVNYDSDLISVGTRVYHRIEVDEELWLSKAKIRSIAYSNNLLEPRSTRHFFPFRKGKINQAVEIDLNKTLSIQHLLSNNDIKNEIKLNIEYINEIEKELKILNGYIEEQIKVKLWLLKQNSYIVSNE